MLLDELNRSCRMEVAVSPPDPSEDELYVLTNMGISLETDARRYRYFNNTRPSAVLFQYTLAGAGVFADEGIEYDLPAGHGFLTIFPSDTGYWLPPGNTWNFFYAIFTGEPACRMAELILHRHGPVIELAGDSPVLAGLAEQYRRAVRGEMEDEFTISAEVYRFFMGLRRAARYPMADLPEPVALAQTFIEQHYTDSGLMLEQIAEAAGYSQFHLSRMFKKHLRINPHEYLIRTRLRRAHDLLASTDQPIKQILTDVGFRDYAHFANSFKKRYGLTPGNVRRQNQRFNLTTVVTPGGCRQ